VAKFKKAIRIIVLRGLDFLYAGAVIMSQDKRILEIVLAYMKKFISRAINGY